MSETQNSTSKQKGTLKTVLKWGGIGILALLIIGLLLPESEESVEAGEAEIAESVENVESDGSAQVEESEVAAVETPTSNWDYEKSADQMTGEEYSFATTTSTNRVEFDFPYNEEGGSHAVITLRDFGKGPDVAVTMSDGQIETSIAGSEFVRVKFDDGETEQYIYNSSDDLDSKTIYLNNDSKFIQKLRGAEKVVVEIPFFQEGRQMMTFDVSGLEWEQ